MQNFIDRYHEDVTGCLNCFDRIVFKGHLMRLGWPDGLEGFLNHCDKRIVEFGKFAESLKERIKKFAEKTANDCSRPFIYLNSSVRKESLVSEIAERDGIESGLICVLRCLELCPSFKVAYGEGRPVLCNSRRNCLCVYYYYQDQEFGRMHVRIQTWFPFVIQVCLNGHNWLSTKLRQHGITFTQDGNCFTNIEDIERAQKMANGFVKKNWPRILSALASRANPLLSDVLAGEEYYWTLDQVEYATDILFRSPAALELRYEKLLDWALTQFGAEDVMTFLGKKLTSNFKGELVTRYNKRWPGARIKHRMKSNWIKMYDKQGSVLRVETVINDPYVFRIWRQGTRNGEEMMGWFPMSKRVGNLYRYAEICLAANGRYLDALAQSRETIPSRQILGLAKPAMRNNKRIAGFNPAKAQDVDLFSAILRGEHTINGFSNRILRERLFGQTPDHKERKRQAARITRLLQKLHARKYIAKIPHSHRWRITAHGWRILGAVLVFNRKSTPHQEASCQDEASGF